jgi:hypothetical protein
MALDQDGDPLDLGSETLRSLGAVTRDILYSLAQISLRGSGEP